MTTGTSEPGPPQAPAFERRLQFARLQLVGMPLVMLVPMLALAGLLGGRREHAERRADDVVVDVAYEGRARYEASSRIEVKVHNAGAVPLAAAQVEIERALLEGFSEVMTSPAVAAIEGDAHVVALGELAPGATRMVIVEFRPSQPGRVRGGVRARVGESARVRVPVEMLVLP